MLIQKFAPVIIPTLNRYKHLERLVNSLLDNDESKNTELVLGLDYPPNDRYVEGYLKVKSYISTIKGFRKVTVLETKENLGFSKNYERLRNYVWAQGYDSYILSEDDNVFAPSFLSYMNWGLETFREDKTVLAICSYREKDEPIPNYPNNFYKAGGVRPYGFGIWKDRFLRYEKRIEFDFMKSLVDEMPLYTIFNREKTRIACKYLYLYQHNIIHDDFCMGQMCVDEKMFCITPVRSLAKTLGLDGSGLHGADADRHTKEMMRILDPSPVFHPIWEEKDLSNQAVVLSEHEIARELTCVTFKEQLRRCFNICKFIVYKLTGKIISYKQN